MEGEEGEGVKGGFEALHCVGVAGATGVYIA